MAKGRTLRLTSITDGFAHAHDVDTSDYLYFPADWLAKGMTEGDTIRATEEMPGVVRFREVTDHKDQQALDDLNSSDPGGDITIDDTNP